MLRSLLHTARAVAISVPHVPLTSSAYQMQKCSHQASAQLTSVMFLAVKKKIEISLTDPPGKIVSQTFGRRNFINVPEVSAKFNKAFKKTAASSQVKDIFIL